MGFNRVVHYIIADNVKTICGLDATFKHYDFVTMQHLAKDVGGNEYETTSNPQLITCPRCQTNLMKDEQWITAM